MNENIIIKTENVFDEFVAEHSQSSSCDGGGYSQFVFRNADVPKVSNGNAQKRQQQQQPQQQQLQGGAAAKILKLSTTTTTPEHFNNTDDAKLQNLLKVFDLEILYSTLKLGDITFRSLPYISVEEINTVIRHIGYRAEFREKLLAWRKDKQAETPDGTQPRPTQAIAPSTRLPQVAVVKTTPATSIVAPTMATPQTTFLNTVNPMTGSNSRTNQELNAAEEFLSLLPGVSSSTVLGTTAATVVLEEAVELEEPLSLLPSTSQGHTTAATKPTVSFNGTKVNVQSLLDSNHIGRTIKQFYAKTGYLENSQRNEIVRIIIEEVMQQGGSLSPKDFRVILDDIIKVFPNEKIASDYYFIYRSGKGNPLGRLYQRYSNENSKRRRLTRLAEEEECSDGDRQSSLMDDDDTVAYPVDLPGLVPKVDEMTALALKQLLTTDHFSWEEVCDKWIQTWALRQKELQQSGLGELITNWIKLSDPRAAELYKIDFRHVYPDKENMLFSKWDEFVKKISGLYDKKLNHEDLKKMYKYCKMGMASKDEKDFLYAVGLTALIPSTARFKDQTGKMRIRAHVGDSIDAFVMRLSSLDLYESHMELRNRKFGPINETAHPVLVVITPNDYTITKIYVALDNRFYCMQSFLQALDLCYKIYHTCGLKYPTVCANVWTFIQRYFFEMNVPWEARNANLTALMISLSLPS